MNKRIIEKTNMFDNVDEVLVANTASVDAVPALKQFVNKFRLKKESIDLKIRALTEDTKGITKNKKKCKLQLATLLAGINGAIRAYGTNIDDHNLKEKARFRLSELKNMRDKELQELSQTIYALANNLATTLLDYDITPNNLTDLDTAIQAFKGLSPKVRSKMVDNKTVRTSMQEAVDETNKILEDIDDLMLIQMKKTPEFYNHYTNARANYSMGSRSRDNQPSVSTAQKLPANTSSKQAEVAPEQIITASVNGKAEYV